MATSTLALRLSRDSAPKSEPQVLRGANLCRDFDCLASGEASVRSTVICLGGETLREESLVDGLDVFITASLESALRNLRLEHSPRALWVDPSCISQSDMEERGYQVRIMGSIYQDCVRCLAWLVAHEQESAKVAFNFLEEIVFTKDKQSIKIRNFNGSDNCPCKLRTLRNLTGRPYWTRA